MREKKIAPGQYLVVVCLLLSLMLALTQISSMGQEQLVLQEEIRELTGMYVEKQEMAALLEEYRNEVQHLMKQNEALEDLLQNRARTYLTLVGENHRSDGVVSLLSRAGDQLFRVDESPVSMPLNTPSGMTPEDFEYLWSKYRAHNLQGTGQALIQAEIEHGVNALALAAIIVHESGWGRSAIARDKNNLAGLGAYDGSAYYSAITFATKDESIMFLAELLSRSYLSPEGRYYNGPNLRGVGKVYASDPRWAYKVARNMQTLIKGALKNPEAMVGYLQGRISHE